MTSEESDLEEAIDNLREIVDGGIGAPGALVEDVLVAEEHMERVTTEYKAREG